MNSVRRHAYCRELSGVAIQRHTCLPCLPCLSSRLRCPCPRARTCWTTPGPGPSVDLSLCLGPTGGGISPVGAPARPPRPWSLPITRFPAPHFLPLITNAPEGCHYLGQHSMLWSYLGSGTCRNSLGLWIDNAGIPCVLCVSLSVSVILSSSAFLEFWTTPLYTASMYMVRALHAAIHFTLSFTPLSTPFNKTLAPSTSILCTRNVYLAAAVVLAPGC
jgi:hypothetical protein